jgi:beta-carotene/zeaxanthin 4-ketolase
MALDGDTLAAGVLRLAIVLISAVVMEGVATLLHRHVMHGPGWTWHRSHHQPEPGQHWERNDLYALVFMALSIGLMLLGQGRWWPLFWVGIGLAVYGSLYALVHDGLVHQRWPLRWRPRQAWLQRLVRAHRLHHAVREREGAVSFGFLLAPPPAELAAALRAQRGGPATAPRPGADAGSRRQSRTGLLLAALIIGSWAVVQGLALFALDLEGSGWWWLPPVVALLCWLDVGLFILAHDAMHGSLAPAWPRLGHAVGRLCLLLYAGFPMRQFAAGHVLHHRHPGTADDPDFGNEGRGYWRWYGRFIGRYLGLRELAGLVLITGMLLMAGAPLANVLCCWALPSALSSLQLFTFGTWLPHRQGGAPFADHHRARSHGWGWWWSLLSCFHFGHHHEHHLRPELPWWRLPSWRR